MKPSESSANEQELWINDPDREVERTGTVEGHALERHVRWKSAAVISMGGSILVAVSLGAMAADLGAASIFVWTFTGILGVLQCLLIAEMAGMFPHKSGGTATYTHEAFKHKSPIPGAISNWGYWLGWIPVIPVNLVLIAGYLKGTIMPGANTLVVAVVLAIVLYSINYFGLKPGLWSSILMAVCAMGPLAVIALSPIFRHSLFHAAYVFPLEPLHGSWSSGTSWLLIFKWMFIAVWSSYAFESASSVMAELKDPTKEGPKAMIAASAVGMFAYGVVPFALLAMVGVEVLSKDPSVAFLPAATAIFGPTGASIVVVMLIAALLLGSQTAIIGSSRTVYEMSRDGLTLKQFGHLNKFGVPDKGMIWDCSITLLMLFVFKDNVINMVGASTIGYLMVWMLLPLSFMLLRKNQPDTPRPFKLPGIFMGVAMFSLIYNWILFFVGGFQWGGFHWKEPFMMGFIIMATFIPFYLYRKKVQDKASARVTSPLPDGAAEAA